MGEVRKRAAGLFGGSSGIGGRGKFRGLVSREGVSSNLYLVSLALYGIRSWAGEDPAWPVWGKVALSTTGASKDETEGPKDQILAWISPDQVVAQLSALDASLCVLLDGSGDDETLDAIGSAKALVQNVQKELPPYPSQGRRGTLGTGTHGSAPIRTAGQVLGTVSRGFD